MTLEEAKIHALSNTPTIRQLYIAAAIQGMLANHVMMKNDEGETNNTFRNYARAAVIQADALLAAEKGWSAHG